MNSDDLSSFVQVSGANEVVLSFPAGSVHLSQQPLIRQTDNHVDEVVRRLNETITQYNQQLSDVPDSAVRTIKLLLSHFELESIRADWPIVSELLSDECVKRLFTDLVQQLRQEGCYFRSLQTQLIELDAALSAEPQDQSSITLILASMKRQCEPLDLGRMISLMEESSPDLSELEGADVLMFFGMTGVGKSTTINFLLRHVMEQVIVDDMPHIHTSGINSLSGFKSSPSGQSETREIQYAEVSVPGREGRLIICDTPGFNDTAGGETDIVHYIKMLEAAKASARIKPVLIISSHMMGARCEGLTTFANSMQSLIPSLSDHLSSFDYLFTHFQKADKVNIQSRIKDKVKRRTRAERSNKHLSAFLRSLMNKTKYLDDVFIVEPLTDDPDVLLQALCVDDHFIENPKEEFRLIARSAISAPIEEQARHYQNTIMPLLKNQQYQLVVYQLNLLERAAGILGVELLSDVHQSCTMTVTDYVLSEFKVVRQELRSLEGCLGATAGQILNHFNEKISYLDDLRNQLGSNVSTDLESVYCDHVRAITGHYIERVCSIDLASMIGNEFNHDELSSNHLIIEFTTIHTVLSSLAKQSSSIHSDSVNLLFHEAYGNLQSHWDTVLEDFQEKVAGKIKLGDLPGAYHDLSRCLSIVDVLRSADFELTGNNFALIGERFLSHHNASLQSIALLADRIATANCLQDVRDDIEQIEKVIDYSLQAESLYHLNKSIGHLDDEKVSNITKKLKESTDRIRSGIIKLFSITIGESIDYESVLSALECQELLCQLHEANPDYGLGDIVYEVNSRISVSYAESQEVIYSFIQYVNSRDIEIIDSIRDIKQKLHFHLAYDRHNKLSSSRAIDLLSILEDQAISVAQICIKSIDKIDFDDIDALSFYVSIHDHLAEALSLVPLNFNDVNKWYNQALITLRSVIDNISSEIEDMTFIISDERILDLSAQIGVLEKYNLDEFSNRVNACQVEFYEILRAHCDLLMGRVNVRFQVESDEIGDADYLENAPVFFFKDLTTLLKLRANVSSDLMGINDAWFESVIDRLAALFNRYTSIYQQLEKGDISRISSELVDKISLLSGLDSYLNDACTFHQLSVDYKVLYYSVISDCFESLDLFLKAGDYEDFACLYSRTWVNDDYHAELSSLINIHFELAFENLSNISFPSDLKLLTVEIVKDYFEKVLECDSMRVLFNLPGFDRSLRERYVQFIETDFFRRHYHKCLSVVLDSETIPRREEMQSIKFLLHILISVQNHALISFSLNRLRKVSPEAGDAAETTLYDKLFYDVEKKLINKILECHDCVLNASVNDLFSQDVMNALQLIIDISSYHEVLFVKKNEVIDYIVGVIDSHLEDVIENDQIIIEQLASFTDSALYQAITSLSPEVLREQAVKIEKIHVGEKLLVRSFNIGLNNVSHRANILSSLSSIRFVESIVLVLSNLNAFLVSSIESLESSMKSQSVLDSNSILLNRVVYLKDLIRSIKEYLSLPKLKSASIQSSISGSGVDFEGFEEKIDRLVDQNIDDIKKILYSLSDPVSVVLNQSYLLDNIKLLKHLFILMNDATQLEGLDHSAQPKNFMKKRMMSPSDGINEMCRIAYYNIMVLFESKENEFNEILMRFDLLPALEVLNFLKSMEDARIHCQEIYHLSFMKTSGLLDFNAKSYLDINQKFRLNLKKKMDDYSKPLLMISKSLDTDESRDSFVKQCSQTVNELHKVIRDQDNAVQGNVDLAHSIRLFLETFSENIESFVKDMKLNTNLIPCDDYVFYNQFYNNYDLLSRFSSSSFYVSLNELFDRSLKDINNSVARNINKVTRKCQYGVKAGFIIDTLVSISIFSQCVEPFSHLCVSAMNMLFAHIEGKSSDIKYITRLMKKIQLLQSAHPGHVNAIIQNSYVFKCYEYRIFKEIERATTPKEIQSKLLTRVRSEDRFSRLKKKYRFVLSTAFSRFDVLFKEYTLMAISDRDHAINTILRDAKRQSDSDMPFKNRVIDLVACCFSYFSITRPGFEMLSSLDDDDAVFLYQFVPHPVQVMSLFALFRIYIIDSMYRQHHLININPGEGKSLIHAVACTILAVFGYQVNVPIFIPLRAYLDSHRDYIKMYEAFSVRDSIHIVPYQHIVLASARIHPIADKLYQALSHSSVTPVNDPTSKDQVLVVDDAEYLLSTDQKSGEYHPSIFYTSPVIVNFLCQLWLEFTNDTDLSYDRVKSLDAYLIMIDHYRHAEKLFCYALNRLLSEWSLSQDEFISYKIINDSLVYVIHDVAQPGAHYGFKTVMHYLYEYYHGSISAQARDRHVGLFFNIDPITAFDISKEHVSIFGMTSCLSALSNSLLKNNSFFTRYLRLPSFNKFKMQVHKPTPEDILLSVPGDFHYELTRQIVSLYKRSGPRTLLVIFHAESSLIKYLRSEPLRHAGLNKKCTSLVTVNTFDQCKAFINEAVGKKMILFLTGLQVSMYSSIFKSPFHLRYSRVNAIQTFLPSTPAITHGVMALANSHDSQYRMILPVIPDGSYFSDVADFRDFDIFSKVIDQHFTIELTKQVLPSRSQSSNVEKVLSLYQRLIAIRHRNHLFDYLLHSNRLSSQSPLVISIGLELTLSTLQYQDRIISMIDTLIHKIVILSRNSDRFSTITIQLLTYGYIGHLLSVTHHDELHTVSSQGANQSAHIKLLADLNDFFSKVPDISTSSAKHEFAIKKISQDASAVFLFGASPPSSKAELITATMLMDTCLSVRKPDLTYDEYLLKGLSQESPFPPIFGICFDYAAMQCFTKMAALTGGEAILACDQPAFDFTHTMSSILPVWIKRFTDSYVCVEAPSCIVPIYSAMTTGLFSAHLPSSGGSAKEIDDQHLDDSDDVAGSSLQ